MESSPQASRSSILRINDQKTLQLIDLYEKEECLWNTELASYKNRAERAAATERIARKLAIKNFDARLVAIKFKNLRNTYCQELKKMAYSCSMGDKVQYKPKVFWFSKLDSFLRPHLHPSSGLSVPQEDKEEFVTDEPAEELVQLTNPEDVLIESSDDEEKTIAVQKRPRLSTPRNHRQDSNVSTEAKQNMDECFDNFGKYVSSMLKTMPKQKAMELQPKIVTLLTSVDFEDNEEHVSQSDESK